MLRAVRPPKNIHMIYDYYMEEPIPMQEFFASEPVICNLLLLARTKIRGVIPFEMKKVTAAFAAVTSACQKTF